MACKRSAVRSRLPPPTNRKHDAQAWGHHHPAGVDTECRGTGCWILEDAEWRRERRSLARAGTIGFRRFVARRHLDPALRQALTTRVVAVRVGGSHRRPGPHRLEA